LQRPGRRPSRPPDVAHYGLSPLNCILANHIILRRQSVGCELLAGVSFAFSTLDWLEWRPDGRIDDRAALGGKVIHTTFSPDISV
jgi:hypothetical protein